jgi:antitoxin (DNA-binding transcriptional repressor) of toxin-antitoxin stability system
VKTLAIEDIHANPHVLDSVLATGEPVVITRSGKPVADLVPRSATPVPARINPRPDFKARFLQMWGPDAFNSTESMAQQFAELRRDRRCLRACFKRGGTPVDDPPPVLKWVDE